MDQDFSQWRGGEIFLDVSVVTLLVLVVALFFIAMIFLPSVVELRKPKDGGPRKIPKSSLKKSTLRSPRLVLVRGSYPSGVRHPIKDLQKVLADAGIQSHRMGERTVRILESVELEPAIEIFDDIIVEGAFKAGAKCVFHGSIKTKGNALVGESVIIDGNLISLGDTIIEDEAVIGGLVHSEGNVRLGEKVFVGLDLVASGDVEIYDKSEVNGNISTHGGAIKVLGHPTVELPKAIDDIG